MRKFFVLLAAAVMAVSMMAQTERIGIQLQKDFPIEVSFDVEYKDYPFFDAILIHINELGTGFDDQF